MNELVDFKKQMICPACDNPLYKDIYGGWCYFDGCSPSYCDGKKSSFTVKCKRFYPHLHWQCVVCHCKFVSETRLGQQRMKEIIG